VVSTVNLNGKVLAAFIAASKEAAFATKVCAPESLPSLIPSELPNPVRIRMETSVGSVPTTFQAITSRRSMRSVVDPEGLHRYTEVIGIVA
jgi:hypothetical protein